MSGKRPKVGERSGNLCSQGKFDCGSSTKITVLYFIRTVVNFSYMMYMENLD